MDVKPWGALRVKISRGPPHEVENGAQQDLIEMIDLGQIWGPKRSLVGQKDRLDAENGGGGGGGGGGGHPPWVWSMTAPPDHPIASDCQSLIADSQSPVYGALCCNLKIDWTSPRPRCGRKGIRTSLRPLIFHRRPYVRTWKCPRKWTSSSPDVITAATRLMTCLCQLMFTTALKIATGFPIHVGNRTR